MPVSGRPGPMLGLVLILAAGAAEAGTGVVAPLGALGVGDAEALKVQRWIEAALASLPGPRWITGGRVVRALRARPTASCESQPRCLGAVARALGADQAVAGEVGSIGGAYMVYLRLVDGAGRVGRAESAVLAPTRPGLREATRELLVRLLMPEKHTGTVQVRVDVPQAWIYLDGRRVARSPAAPLGGIPVGTHALRVTHEAYRDFVQFIQVGFDRRVEVSVRLAAYPVKAEEMRLIDAVAERPLTSPELPWYRRWWAITAMGAVVLAASATTVAILARGPVARDQEAIVRP